MNSISTEVIPSGGIVKIVLGSADTGPWTLTRNWVDAGAVARVVNLSVNAGESLFLDIGDGTNLPLNQSLAYTYHFTTTSGTVTSVAVTPSSSLTIEEDTFGRILLRVFQGGFAGLTLPDGFKRPTVMESMPITGQPTLPIIALNEDLLQQVNVPIGHGVNTDNTRNVYIVEDIAHRRFRISILTNSTEEREFYKQAVIGIFRSVLCPMLGTLGQKYSPRVSGHIKSSRRGHELPWVLFLRHRCGFRRRICRSGIHQLRCHQ